MQVKVAGPVCTTGRHALSLRGICERADGCRRSVPLADQAAAVRILGDGAGPATSCSGLLSHVHAPFVALADLAALALLPDLRIPIVEGPRAPLPLPVGALLLVDLAALLLLVDRGVRVGVGGEGDGGEGDGEPDRD